MMRNEGMPSASATSMYSAISATTAMYNLRTIAETAMFIQVRNHSMIAPTNSRITTTIAMLMMPNSRPLSDMALSLYGSALVVDQDRLAIHRQGNVHAGGHGDGDDNLFVRPRRHRLDLLAAEHVGDRLADLIELRAVDFDVSRAVDETDLDQDR